VWLIFVAIILFNGFPPAFVALNRALLMSLFLVLLGIVFRGADFVFRATMPIPRFCNGLPNLASKATPFFLSASVGAISTGHLQINESGHFHGDIMPDWLTPL